ncbi:MAG: hypothetical protein LUC41_03570 [Clostridiales bacterium]|nr:hypothetical protein [Clostridiales bacterium]
MKIPAIRSQMGTWVYYLSTLSFDDINGLISSADCEKHSLLAFSDMFPQEYVRDYKDLAKYLVEHDDRFLNALILAVYDGNPMWNELRIEGEDGEDIYDMGLLSLSGEEKIFPINGHNIVDGIKKALQEKPELGSERVAVIFIGHP